MLGSGGWRQGREKTRREGGALSSSPLCALTPLLVAGIHSHLAVNLLVWEVFRVGAFPEAEERTGKLCRV